MNQTTSNSLDWYLQFSKGPKDTGVPYLPVGYSYLLKVSSNMGTKDVYPWLLDLIFRSSALSGSNIEEIINERDSETRAKIEKKRMSSINSVCLFVDESSDSISEKLMPRAQFKEMASGNDANARFIQYEMKDKSLERAALPRLFMIDTEDTRFANKKSLEPEVTPDKTTLALIKSKVPGSGNVMELLKEFRNMGTIRHFVPPKEGTPEIKLGAVNLIYVHTLTNLARNLGFDVAMKFINALSQKYVAQDPEDPKPNEERALRERPGILITCLDEDIVSKAEMRTAETLFDGVITFRKSPRTTNSLKIEYEITRIPSIGSGLVAKSSALHSEESSSDDFLVRANYGKTYEYEPKAANGVLQIVEHKTAEQSVKARDGVEANHAK